MHLLLTATTVFTLIIVSVSTTLLELHQPSFKPDQSTNYYTGLERLLQPLDMTTTPVDDDTYSQMESGYHSGSSSSEVELPEIYFSKPHLKFLNQQLNKLEPEGQ